MPKNFYSKQFHRRVPNTAVNLLKRVKSVNILRLRGKIPLMNLLFSTLIELNLSEYYGDSFEKDLKGQTAITKLLTNEWEQFENGDCNGQSNTWESLSTNHTGSRITPNLKYLKPNIQVMGHFLRILLYHWSNNQMRLLQKLCYWLSTMKKLSVPRTDSKEQLMVLKRFVTLIDWKRWLLLNMLLVTVIIKKTNLKLSVYENAGRSNGKENIWSIYSICA